MRARVPRLPGIRFETVEPPGDDLPRMDIAVFVGFAASGPLHLPVAVADMAEYAAIFGGEVPLAYDAARGTRIAAYLPGAVRAFFRNGGRRCWVIRVADEALARTNRFPLPGLWQTQEHGAPQPAHAEARSPGSWSDALRTAAVLRAEPLACIDLRQRAWPRVALALEGPRDLAPGDLLRATFRPPQSPLAGDGLGAPPNGDTLGFLLAVERVGDAPKLASPPESPLEGVPGAVWVEGPAWLFARAPDSPLASPPDSPLAGARDEPAPGDRWQGATWVAGPAAHLADLPLPDVERLTFDLVVRDGDGAPARLRGLGFAPAHPRYWASLPSDERRFRPADEPPVDADDADEAHTTPTPLWAEAAQLGIPLCGRGAPRVVYLPLGMGHDPRYAAADRQAGSALARDGLGAFGDRLFLDPDLATTGSERLLADGAYIRYAAPATRRLRGIHAALLGPEEVAMIAVPDAVHRGWAICPRPPVVEASDLQVKPPEPDACVPPLPQGDGEPEAFADCGVLPAPRLEKVDNTSGAGAESASYEVRWSPVPGAGVRYLLQEATRGDFLEAKERGPYTAPRATIEHQPEGTYFYRVRALSADAESPWSGTVRVRVDIPEPAELVAVTAYDPAPLTRLHRAVLRLCAARGDLFAVLALPRHSLEEDALAHGDRLAAAPEERARSFGALFHPWLIGRGAELAAPLRETPPDGATCGLIARRTLRFGAWYAPANEPLVDVLALTPAVAPARWLDLQEAGINVVRHEAGGFLLLSANTLERDDELRPINVRRLLILLRRLALRRGARYVFEPNDAAFRRLVQRGFEATLDDLFVRGAFAGDTPDSAYQVDTGPGLNTPQSVDAGRFVVELRVAPSRPLTFLTVRLVQTGDRELAVLEG